MPYQKTVWNNGASPGINAQNLNNIENGIETVDNDLAAHKANIATPTTLGHVKAETDAEGNLIIPEPQLVWEKIADVTLDSDVAQVDFANLGLENYKSVKILINAMSSNALYEPIWIRVNDVSTASYDYARHEMIGSGSTTGSAGITGSSRFELFDFDASYRTVGELKFSNIENEEPTFSYYGFQRNSNDGSANALVTRMGGGIIPLGALVNKISFFFSNSNNKIKTGSTFTLMGVK